MIASARFSKVDYDQQSYKQLISWQRYFFHWKCKDMRFYKLGATMNNEKCLMSTKTDF